MPAKPRDVDPHSSNPSEMNLPVQIGRYRISRQLGVGGMGAVYLAHDTSLERSVALKVPNQKVLGSDSARERFLREAKASAQLSHPNVCPVYDVGEHEGQPYLAMAFVEGRTLAELIETHRPLPLAHVLYWIGAIASALHQVHQAGILHRDLKPSNIMVNTEGVPIVMDFGLAKWFDTIDATLTQDGAILGTPRYMSPEQAEGKHRTLTPASDIFSLGIILYEALAGFPPFDGPTHAAIHQIIMMEPSPLEETRGDLHPRLIAACQRAMAKSPAHRFSTMAEFAAELQAVADLPADSFVTIPKETKPRAADREAGTVRTRIQKETSTKQSSSASTHFVLDDASEVIAKVPRRKKPRTFGMAVPLVLLVGAIGLGVKYLPGLLPQKAPVPSGNIEFHIEGAPGSAKVTLNGKPTTVGDLEALKKLPPGNYRVKIQGETIEPVDRTFVVKDREFSPFNIFVVPKIEAILNRPGVPLPTTQAKVEPTVPKETSKASDPPKEKDSPVVESTSVESMTPDMSAPNGTGIIEVFKNLKGGYRFRVKNGREETVLISPMDLAWGSETLCRKAIDELIQGSIFEVTPGREGEPKFRFSVREKGGRTLAVHPQESWPTKADCEEALAEVKACLDMPSIIYQDDFELPRFDSMPNTTTMKPKTSPTTSVKKTVAPSTAAKTISTTGFSTLPEGSKVLRYFTDNLLATAPTSPAYGGKRYKMIAVPMTANSTVRIELNSTMFDAFLYLQGPTQNILAQNDDSGGKLNARIDYRITQSGIYYVVVSSLNGNVGAYRLRVAAIGVKKTP